MISTARTYLETFGSRGNSYADAMNYTPRARDAEFKQLFTQLDMSRISQVADVPAGAGYLRPFLPDKVALDAYDPTASFRRSGENIRPVDLERPALAHSDYDLIVSLASLHHVEDKRRFFDGLAGHSRSNGRIVLADATAGSKVATFLDHYVGHHNGTGHEGWYLDQHDPFSFGRSSDRVSNVAIETLQCPWAFVSERQMAAFCTLLFGLSDCPVSEVLAALRSHIGVSWSNGCWELQWELTYITIELN